LWDERHAQMRERQAERAAWLSGRNRQARQLALRLWAADARLDVAATETVVSAMLAAPDLSVSS
jgi:hypothetical protein